MVRAFNRQMVAEYFEPLIRTYPVRARIKETGEVLIKSVQAESALCAFDLAVKAFPDLEIISVS